jgi:hypothetical protein
MSERRLVVLALLVAAGSAGPALAQRAPDSTALLRTRLAQANALAATRDDLRHQQEEALAPRRFGRIQTEGNVTLVVSEAALRDSVVRLATSADSMLADFGAIPDSFVRTFVYVMPFVSDAAALLASPALRGRRPIRLDWNGEAAGSRLGDGWMLVEPVVRSFRASRDSTWQEWLDNFYGVYWPPAESREGAIAMLTSPDYVVGEECLAGRARSCRLWLGLDRDAQPYLARYKPEELLRIARGRSIRGADGVACRAGEAAACARAFTSQPWLGVPAIPAPEHLRSSLVRAVRELHGPEAVRLALADQRGAVGERLSRAAGVSEDSLVTEWRHWVLSRGRMERVSAGVGDALTALLFTALLVGLAARSGRWR